MALPPFDRYLSERLGAGCFLGGNAASASGLDTVSLRTTHLTERLHHNKNRDYLLGWRNAPPDRTALCASCAARLTALGASCAAILTALHPDSLGFNFFRYH